MGSRVWLGFGGGLAVMGGALWMQAQTAGAPQNAPMGQPQNAQQQQAPTPPPDVKPLYRRDPNIASITAVARTVLIDVTVLDNKGKPVTGLKQSDFVVEEDGKTQKVNSFNEHTQIDPAKMPPNPVHLPANTFTNFVPVGNDDALTVILMDANNSSVPSQAYARDQIEKFVKTLEPGHPVAIFEMDTQMHLVQGFTTDPQVLMDAVKSKRDDVRLPSPFLHRPGYVGTLNRIDTLNGGLDAMARYLSGFPGRKNLVWFTGQIPGASWGEVSSNFPEIQDYSEEMKSASETLALSRVSVYPVDARGLQTNPAFSAAHSGVPTHAEMANFGTAQFFDHSAMDDIAKATGGRAFYNTNGLKEAMQRVVDTGSYYYTIAYTPTNANWNGQYRKIHVDLAGNNAGVQLQYRTGYVAQPPAISQNEKQAMAQRAKMAKSQPQQQAWDVAMIPANSRDSMGTAMGLGAIPPTEIVFRASLTESATEQKLNKKDAWPKGNFLREDLRGKPWHNYKVTYAMMPQSVRLSKSADGLHHGDVMFVAVLYNDKGEQVNSASTTITMDLQPDTYDKLMKGLFGTEQLIAVPEKGNYFLRLGVHDVNGNKVGAMEVPVDEVKPGITGYQQTPAP